MITTTTTTTTTTTAATTKKSLPDLVQRELPLAVPPISPQRARDAYTATQEVAAEYGGDDDWTEEITTQVNKGISISEIQNTYTNFEYLKILERGGCLFSFSCHHQLAPYEAEMVDSIINLTAFEDEVKENYVPHFEDSGKYKDALGDIEEQDEKNSQEETEQAETKNNSKQPKGVPAFDWNPSSLFTLELPAISVQEKQKKVENNNPYTFLLARASYLLFDVDLQKLLGQDGPSILSSPEYHQKCEPTGTKVWTDTENMEPNNFRITKTIIPRVYDIVVQFRVSALDDKDVLKQIGRHAGTRIDGGILLERTKRSKPPKEDATKKAKSVLLYTDLGEGVCLVTHLTVVLQRGLPDPIERLINYLPNRFQSWGLGETWETAWRTRRYLKKVAPRTKVEDEEVGDEFDSFNSSSDDEDKFEDAQS